MKKLFVAASLLVASLSVNAQEYKPVAGSVTSEVGITGGLLLTDVGLNDMGNVPNFGQLKFRYFLADDLAARVGFAFYRNSETEVVQNAFVAPIQEGEIKASQSLFLLNLGVEKHLAGTDRLATYVGADLLLGFGNQKEEGTDVDFFGGYSQGDSYSIEGGTNNIAFATPVTPGTSFGFRLVTGAEYYFIEKAFLGVELGWGVLATSTKDEETTVTTGGTSTTSTVLNGKVSNVAASAVAAVRLGWRF